MEGVTSHDLEVLYSSSWGERGILAQVVINLCAALAMLLDENIGLLLR